MWRARGETLRPRCESVDVSVVREPRPGGGNGLVVAAAACPSAATEIIGRHAVPGTRTVVRDRTIITHYRIINARGQKKMYMIVDRRE